MPTVDLSGEDLATIITALKCDAARLRRSAPQPSYVGSAQSRAYCATMGEAVKRDRLAAVLEEEHASHALNV